MKALIFDRSKTDWEASKGFELADMPQPSLGEGDDNKVIIKVKFAGVCGTDKGIWFRQAFKDQILSSLESEGKNIRAIGHEFFGEVIEVGTKVSDVKVGDFVSCESHVVCNQCFQCLNGQKNVCTNEKILGISIDGGFAEFVKVPQHIVWKTNMGVIQPEIAAMQEPFGNAVHAASKVNLKGKTVAIFGLGPIGSFLVLIARGLGAKKIIGVEPNPKAQEMGKQLGVDCVVPLLPSSDLSGYHHDQNIIDAIMKETGGLGVDVAFEMSGFNDALNNTIASVRRGGDVILFGIKNKDFVLEDYNRLVMKGVTMHCVAGRQIWGTWEITKKLLEDKSNGVQEKLWKVILQEGKDTILDINDYTKERFEEMMGKSPKFLIKF